MGIGFGEGNGISFEEDYFLNSLEEISQINLTIEYPGIFNQKLLEELPEYTVTEFNLICIGKKRVSLKINGNKLSKEDIAESQLFRLAKLQWAMVIIKDIVAERDGQKYYFPFHGEFMLEGYQWQTQD